MVPVLARLLGIREPEIRPTLALGAFHFLFVSSVVLVKSASNAAVVARYAASALPPLYVATAVVTGLTAFAAARLGGGARGLPGAGLFVSAFLLAGTGLLWRAGFPPAVTGLYLFGEAFATLVSIRFWSVASERFDPRASRRIFGLLGGAGMAGAILAGLGTQILGTRVGAMGLLPFACVAVLASAAVAWLARSSVSTVQKQPLPQARPAGGLATLAGDRYARTLAGLMVALAVITALADFIFRRRAGSLLAENELASLFGALNLWMGVLAVLFQVGVAGRVLERFGVFRYLLFTPVLAAACGLSCIFIPKLAPAFALRLVEGTGSLSLNPSAFQLLYGPVPDDRRPQLRAAIDGLVKKGGFALGGLLLLPFSDAPVAILVTLLLLVVAFFAWQLAKARPLYVGIIETRLSRIARGVLPGGSAEIRSALARSLGSADPVRVLTSLTILSDDMRFDPLPHLPGLLAHPDERVRLLAVRLVARRRLPGSVPALESLLESGSRRDGEQAATALVHLAPERARELLRPLAAGDGPLSGAALAGLIVLDGEGGSAGRLLQKRLDAAMLAAAPERRSLAHLLGLLPSSRFGLRLEQLLRDPFPEVRREACDSAEAVRDPLLAPPLMALLGDRSCRDAARRALLALGDQVVRPLEALLNDRGSRLAVRLEVPRVLRAIGTAEAARALLFSNIQDDAYLRYRIAMALSRIHEEHPEIAVDKVRLRQAMLRRLRAYRRFLPVYRDLEAALPPGSLLVRVIDDRLEQNLEVVFRLLHIEQPEANLLAAFRTFASGDARERAWAIELVEHKVEEGMRSRLIPALDRYHRLPAAWGHLPGVPERAPKRLADLARSTDAVVRGCAHFTGRRFQMGPTGRLPPGGPEEAYVDEEILEKVFFLEGVEMFAGCEVDDLVGLASIARVRTYRQGDTIFEEGGPGDALFVILEGLVRVDKGGSLVLQLGARDAFGESSLVDGRPRPVRAMADAPVVRVLHVERREFLDLIADRPELLKGIFAAVTRHLRALIDVAAGQTAPSDKDAA